QIGEFSFILMSLGLTLGLVPEAARDLVLAGAILSITVNPAVFLVADTLRKRRLEREAAKAAPVITPTIAPEEPEGPRHVTETEHVIIVGYGRVGKRVADELAGRGVPTVVIESDLERVERIREGGRTAILGNAVRDEVLKAAGVETATHLIVAVPNGLEAGEIVAHARKLKPALYIIARAHLDAEVEHITESGANRVIMGEREIARQMLADCAPAPSAA
ncbi:MAG TPA: NAD-binding protein, partial [Verrucomicrobiae bacterium]|nr:NAD-binding protein [Verrucomicrobiae bacterium]